MLTAIWGLIQSFLTGVGIGTVIIVTIECTRTAIENWKARIIKEHEAKKQKEETK